MAGTIPIGRDDGLDLCSHALRQRRRRNIRDLEGALTRLVASRRSAITSMKRFCIISDREDLHAHAVKKELEEHYRAECHIVELTPGKGRSRTSWSNGGFAEPVLSNIAGDLFPVSKLDVVWWRRADGTPPKPSVVTAREDLIRNDSRAATTGILASEFQGAWVSDPYATRQAENKIVQMRAAQRAGFLLPKTLVSQDPARVLPFCKMLGNRAVVKPLRGTPLTPLLTRFVDVGRLTAKAISLCPAIYQEYVPGKLHIRAHCFGDSVHAALLESEDLDWRPNLAIPVREFQLPEKIQARLRRVLRLLGLRVGIFDLKLAPTGEPVWLEVNPQGQFLFIEGLCGMPLTALFAKFLYREAQTAPRTVRPLAFRSGSALRG